MDTFRFADFSLEPGARQLRRGVEVVALGARAFDLLELLVVNRNRVVGRDEIMVWVWPDAVVGENNLNVQAANLCRVLGAGTIVTVPGRGLRFARDVAPDAPPLALPDRPSVVVLPFASTGVDPELDWLTDGFVEDITTELSRFRDLFVVARNSAFAFRGIPRDLRKIARELGVRYVVEGSVRATPDRVRVNFVQLAAVTGGHVWAENFDTQARVARSIVSCLSPQIDRAEADRIRAVPPEDLTAHGIAQRAWTVISSGELEYCPAPREQAAALARQALDRDPRAGLAGRVPAWVAWWHVYHGTTASVSDTLADGIDAALVLALQNRMRGDLGAVFEDPNLVRVVLDLDDALAGRIRNAVVVSVDRDHALVADPPLHGQHRIVGDCRQSRQAWSFLGKGFVHNAPCRRMDPRICDAGPPAVELGIQIVEVPERPCEKEVLPDVAERALDLAFRLRAIRPAQSR